MTKVKKLYKECVAKWEDCKEMWEQTFPENYADHKDLGSHAFIGSILFAPCAFCKEYKNCKECTIDKRICNPRSMTKTLLRKFVGIHKWDDIGPIIDEVITALKKHL